MAHSGASQTIVATARSGGERRTPDWGYIASSVRGPLLTLVILIGLDQIARHREPLTHPFPLLLLTVAYAAYAGGLLSAVVSAVLTGLYAAHFLSEPGRPLHYSDGNSLALLVTLAAAAGMAALVSRLRMEALKGQAERLERTEAEALDRRVSFLTQASATLASSMPKKKLTGPEPDRLKLEGNWKDLVAKALTKKRPPTGWPKPKQKKGQVA